MLVGVSYEEMERIFLSVCGKNEETTVWDRLDVLQHMNVDILQEYHYRNKPTLTQWFTQEHLNSLKYQVSLTGHVVAIHKGLVFDQVFRKGVPALRSPYKRKRIHSTLVIGNRRW